MRHLDGRGVMSEKISVWFMLAVFATFGLLCAGAGYLAAEERAETAGLAAGDSLVQVNIDVRPGLCPNHLRLESALTIPIAVLGTVEFEVFAIDPATVRLSRKGAAGEAAPTSWAYADVGTPLIGGLCACHKRRGDGLDDLEFSFQIADLVEMLDLGGHADETIPVTLSGVLATGEVFEGTDCAHIISGFWPGEESGDEIGFLAPAGEQPGGDGFKFAYFTTVTDRVTFMIYDNLGRKVAKIHDMDMPPGIYNAVWDGTDSDSLLVDPGIYFARVSNSFASDTRKISLP